MFKIKYIQRYYTRFVINCSFMLFFVRTEPSVSFFLFNQRISESALYISELLLFAFTYFSPLRLVPFRTQR